VSSDPAVETRLRPGKLLRTGLACMGKYLGPFQSQRWGAAALKDQDETALQPIATQYLTTILQQARAGRMGRRDERELRTLSEALDCLLTGKMAEAGDLLIQRFKAVEASDLHGWDVAEHLELTPHRGVSSAHQSELSRATKRFTEAAKLRQLTGASRPSKQPG
jgi:hypothetical protein